jgi:hypothetical protein
MLSGTRLVIGIGLVGMLTTPCALAQGVSFAVFDGPYPDAELNRQDLETGELTPVGPVGFPVTQIAFDRQGTLYGIDPSGARLVLINPMDGSGTPVGDLGVSIVAVAGLSFDSDGRLWMTAIDPSLGPSLFEIETGTGAASWTSSIDMAYFGALAGIEGTVYLASYTLSTIDTSTGFVSPVPGSTLEIWTGRALDADDDGRLWGLMLCGPCMLPWDVLITSAIDPGTGLLVDDGLTQPHGTWGLAILPGGLFLDGFETGHLGAWTGAATTRQNTPGSYTERVHHPEVTTTAG